MKIVEGKKYRIVGVVNENHGDCQGDIIIANSDEGTWTSFDGLRWLNGVKGEDYVLCCPSGMNQNCDDEYYEWLDTVLEEVE